ncbi:MAG: signal peptidase II [Patescibacteria group bacterium]
MKKLLLPILFFVSDRLLKYFAPSTNLEGGFLKFGFYPNFGGAFSLPISGTFYNLAGLIFLGFFIYLFLKKFKTVYTLQVTAYGFIVFGGASNMFDRLSFGYVIDYFNVLNFSFFNIADGMLILGIAILIFSNFRKRDLSI